MGRTDGLEPSIIIVTVLTEIINEKPELRVGIKTIRIRLSSKSDKPIYKEKFGRSLLGTVVTKKVSKPTTQLVILRWTY